MLCQGSRSGARFFQVEKVPLCNFRTAYPPEAFSEDNPQQYEEQDLCFSVSQVITHCGIGTHLLVFGGGCGIR